MREYISIIVSEIIFFLGVVACYFVGLKTNHMYGWHLFSFMFTVFVFINLITGVGWYFERSKRKNKEDVV
jgi:heme/copper-type cytochrome/quinol oxidase subunit 4